MSNLGNTNFSSFSRESRAKAGASARKLVDINAKNVIRIL